MKPPAHLGVPPKINPSGKFQGPEDRQWIWKEPVEQTSSYREKAVYSERTVGADLFSNNFGVGDEVLYHPEREPDKLFEEELEGKVLEIHSYFGEYCPNVNSPRHYLTRTSFNGRKRLIVAKSLEALTCNHIDIDTSKFDGFLDDAIFTYNPITTNDKYLKVAFQDDVARAIWMGIRCNHLMAKGWETKLAKYALDMSDKLDRAANLDGHSDRVHYWFKNRPFTPRYLERMKLEDPQVAAMVPYLTGEKVATYVIKEVA